MKGIRRLIGYLKDERGVETLEWIAVGAAIVALALLVYPGTLQTGIGDVITDIVTKLKAVN